MKQLFQKLFNRPPQSPDGLTQAQREAVVDVLFYCMYADNSLALKEDQILADTLGAFSWDPKVSYDLYAARSIANARAVKETPATRADFLASVAQRLATRELKQRTLELCRQIIHADGSVADSERQLLRELEAALS
jgi:uncharacterized tellurite resistance protein B-like protein